MTKHILGAIISLLLSGHPGSPQSGTLYTIDQTQSSIDITIFQDGFLGRVRPSHAIQVKTFNGWVKYETGREGQSTAEVEAEAKSLFNAEKGISEVERREFEAALRNVVLEAPKYPLITLRSVSISDLKSTGQGHNFVLNGDLTMHGVKRRVAIPVAVVVSGKQLTATGEVAFKQTDFEMKPYEAAFGLIKIRDEVKVSFSIVARAA